MFVRHHRICLFDMLLSMPSVTTFGSMAGRIVTILQTAEQLLQAASCHIHKLRFKFGKIWRVGSFDAVKGIPHYLGRISVIRFITTHDSPDRKK